MSQIHIRATSLEKFWNCKYRYKNETQPDPMKEAFIFGSTLHNYAESYILWNLNQDLIDILMSPRPIKQRQMIQLMWWLVAEQVSARELSLVTTELKMLHYFEEQDVIVEWTMDCLLKDKDWTYIIMDIKTAKSNRTDEHFNWVKQKIIYPAMMKLCFWVEIKAFEYRVLNKTLSPKLSVFRYELNGSEVDQLKAAIIALRNSEELGERETNYENYSCGYCPFRTACRKANQKT